MSKQELSPRVQHGDEPRVHFELRPRARHVQQRLRSRREEQVVDQRPVVMRQLGECFGQRHDDVVIRYGQHLGQSVLIPRVPPIAAALRTMAIATRVKVVLRVPTRVTMPLVSAEHRRAARFDLPQCAVLLRRERMTTRAPIARGVTPKHVGQGRPRRGDRRGDAAGHREHAAAAWLTGMRRLLIRSSCHARKPIARAKLGKV